LCIGHDGGRLLRGFGGRGGLRGRRRRAAGLGLGCFDRRGPRTEEDALRQGVIELVGVAGEIDVVEAENAEEVIDALDVPVGDFRLDGVAGFAAE